MWYFTSGAECKASCNAHTATNTTLKYFLYIRYTREETCIGTYMDKYIWNGGSLAQTKSSTTLEFLSLKE